MWGICVILTVTNVLEEGHPARTDARLRVLTDSAWFYIPYPGQNYIISKNSKLNHRHHSKLYYFRSIWIANCFYCRYIMKRVFEIFV